MVCRGCGKESAEGFSFCPHCGEVLVAASPAVESPSFPLEVGPVVNVATVEPAPTHSIATDRTNEIGTYVFGAFSVISLLVSMIKGVVPIYLAESAIWAGAAWYWYSKKSHSELAKAVVIVFAALVVIGEGIQIASQFRSEPTQTRLDNANPFDNLGAGQYPSTNPSQAVGAGSSAASHVADLENQAIALFNRKQYKEARPLFEQACNGTDDNGFKYVGFDGEMKACNYLGYLYAQGLGGAHNTKKARDIYQRACDQGMLSSCASLGSLYQDAGDDDNARSHFQKACNGGVTEACDLLRGIK